MIHMQKKEKKIESKENSSFDYCDTSEFQQELTQVIQSVNKLKEKTLASKNNITSYLNHLDKELQNESLSQFERNKLLTQKNHSKFIVEEVNADLKELSNIESNFTQICKKKRK